MKFVTVAPGLEMQTTPCTQAQWFDIMGTRPSYFQEVCSHANRPVEQVSFNDVMEACEKLNSEQSDYTYRLPTEQEWEAAAKSCDDQPALDCAWVWENSNGTTHSVGQKLPNALGLYDMLGNIWEWTSSFWELGNSSRVFRGGSWYIGAQVARSARRGAGPGYRDGYVGFRFVRTPRNPLPLLPSDSLSDRRKHERALAIAREALKKIEEILG